MSREKWPRYRTVRNLIHRHVDRPGIVIGGGPSAPAQIEKCPTDAIVVSANDHGFKLRACDFIASLDRIEQRVRAHDVPLVSRHLFADYRVLQPPQPNSGILGAWLLRLLGCSPIYLVGMDCYDGQTYFHDPAAKSSGFAQSPREHLERWRAFLKAFPGNYAAFSKALMKHLDASPLDNGIPSREKLLREITGTFVQFGRDGIFRAYDIDRPVRAGDVCEVSPDEARELVRRRQACMLRPEAAARYAIAS